jgi:hypothetical protein
MPRRPEGRLCVGHCVTRYFLTTACWLIMHCSCPSELMFRQASSGDSQQLRAGAPGVSNVVGYSFLLSVSHHTRACFTGFVWQS